MRKYLWVFLSAVLILNSPSVFAGVAVTSVQGEVSLARKYGQPEPVKKDSEIYSGDILKTAAGGSVDVSFYGNAGMRFDSAAEIVFTNTNPTKINLALNSGSLIARFKDKIPEGSSFEIETSTAVLAVRGTQFWGQVISAGEKPVTSFAVREGVLRITSKRDKKKYKLIKNQAIELTQDGPAMRRDAKPEEITAIQESEKIKIMEGERWYKETND